MKSSSQIYWLNPYKHYIRIATKTNTNMEIFLATKEREKYQKKKQLYTEKLNLQGNSQKPAIPSV